MMPPDEFSVEVVRHGGALIVAPQGEVDMATADELRAACGAADGMLVLDLRAVEFMDTSGLNLVMECQRRADVDGGGFAVVRGSAPVMRIFEIAGLNHRLRFVNDPAEALGDGQQRC
jgi:anti-sigma B factor antagonist